MASLLQSGIGFDKTLLAACERLRLAQPYPHLIELPNANGTVKSITTATVILFERMSEGGVTLLMAHQSYKEGSCAFPGGFRAGAPEDKYDTSTDEQKEFEKFFPLLTAARELSEEIPFLFIDGESDVIKNAYRFLNDLSTKTLKNSGWNHFPVLMYVKQLTEQQTGLIDKALRKEISVVTEEISEISRISLAVLKQAFTSHGWTKEGLENRARLISAASAKKEKADLTAFQQYEQKVVLVNTMGKRVIMTDYTARSIFNSLEEIERLTA